MFRVALFFILLTPHLLFAQEISPLQANENLRQLTTEVMTLTDLSGHKTLTEVLLLQNEFTYVPQPFSAGYAYGAHWFRISLQRTIDAQKNWLLSASPSEINNLQLYIPDSDGKFTLHQSGNQVAAALRPIDNQFGAFNFPITLTDVTTVFYMRLQTQTPSRLQLKVATPTALIQANILQKLLVGLSIDSLLLIAITLLIIWSHDP